MNGYTSLELEVGCGNGKFIVEHAMEREGVYFIGIEYSYKAAKKAVSKAYKRNIKNLTIIFGEALSTIDNFFKDKYMFDRVYLNFPDPWPKKRHAHRRIFTNDFLERVHSVLKDTHNFYVVTDDETYALETMLPTLEASPLFQNTLKNKFERKLEGYKKTLYEEKMRSMGKEIYFFVYKKI